MFPIVNTHTLFNPLLGDGNFLNNDVRVAINLQATWLRSLSAGVAPFNIHQGGYQGIIRLLSPAGANALKPATWTTPPNNQLLTYFAPSVEVTSDNVSQETFSDNPYRIAVPWTGFAQTDDAGGGLPKFGASGGALASQLLRAVATADITTPSNILSRRPVFIVAGGKIYIGNTGNFLEANVDLSDLNFILEIEILGA